MNILSASDTLNNFQSIKNIAAEEAMIENALSAPTKRNVFLGIAISRNSQTELLSLGYKLEIGQTPRGEPFTIIYF